MASLSREAIETYMNLTGSSEPVSVLKLTEHGGNLNEAVDAHFRQVERNRAHETSVASPMDDFMEIDHPRHVEYHRPPSSLFPRASALFHLLDPRFPRRIFDSGTSFISREPIVSHPRQVREIPIEVKDENGQSDRSGLAPKIEDVTETSHEQGPEIRGIVMMDDEDDDTQIAPTSFAAGGRERTGSVFDNNSQYTHVRPSAPGLVEPDVTDDIEEEMIRAAIEASKQDAEMVYPTDSMSQQRQSHSEDPDLAEAVSLSLKTAEQEKVLHELGENIGPSEPRTSKLIKEELGTLATSDGRLERGRLSAMDDPEDLEEQPLVRHWSRQASSGSVDNARGIGVDLNPPSSSQEQHTINHPGHTDSDFPSHEETERQLAAKKASLPPEPPLDDENAVTLLVRMPDGSRRGRRFLKTDRLQFLFDFIDIGRVVKPGTYRLVRPYPRRAFSSEESDLALSKLGLSSKQEALFLELI